jgi:type VI secretion system Hcp family effector
MKANDFVRRFAAIRPLFILLISILLVTYPLKSISQNIGIGTDTPTEKLQVEGKVFSSDGGFKFPDGSVQSRAYNAYETQDAADPRWIVVMEIPGVTGSYSNEAHTDDMKVTNLEWGAYFNVTENQIPPLGGCHFKLLTVIKDIDMASPVLMQYWWNGIPQLSPVFWFMKYNPDTQSYEDYYKIELQHAYIVKFTQTQTYIGGDGYAHQDEVAFIYTKIRLTWLDPYLQFDGDIPLCATH